MAYISELSIERNQLDADGFLPTSQKIVIGNYVQDKDNLPLLIDRANGGAGGQVYSAGVVAMSVTGGTDYAIAQTKLCHPYVSSHPSVYTMTFSGFDTEVNTVKRVGAWRSNVVAPYASNYDGIYLESDGTTYNVVIAKGGVLNTIARVDWDDPLDGTGASGINYNWNAFTVLQIDFLYLGGTWVRFGLIVGGEIIYFHTYRHSGTALTTFCDSPYFHIRWELRSTGGAGVLGQICGAFSVLGGTDTIGKEIGFSNAATNINANVVGTEYLLLACRLKSTSLNAFVIPATFTALASSNDNFLIRARLNPTIAGVALTWNNLVNTSAEYALGDAAGSNTITATNPTLGEWYGQSNSVQTIQRAFLAALGSALNGTADIFTLSVVPLSVNLDIYASLNLKEI